MASIIRRCRWAWFVIIGSFLWGVPGCGADNEVANEKAAADLLSQALVIGEWDREPRFFPTIISGDGREQGLYQRILKHYAGTRAARIADYSYAYSLVACKSLDEAVARAKSIIAHYPGTADAAWARVVLGRALTRTSNDRPAAIRELRNVASTLPDRADLGPFHQSRWTLGQWCEQYLAGRGNVLDAVQYLGLDKTDPKARAETLAIVAAYRAGDRNFDSALPVLERLAKECPSETDEINWARCRVAAAYLKQNNYAGPLAPRVVDWLKAVPKRTGDDLSAEACLWLARYYSAHGLLSDAVAVLQEGKQKYLETARGAQVLYSLGSLLDRQGKRAEALAVMKELVESKPLEPYYASLGEFFIKEQATLGKAATVADAMKDAEGRYSPEWRFLAFRPSDPLLDTGWMIAAQSVALVKERSNEDAMALVTSLGALDNLPRPELLAARGEVLLYSMRSASDLGTLLR